MTNQFSQMLNDAYNSGLAKGKEKLEENITSWSIQDFLYFQKVMSDKYNIPKYNRKY